MQSRQGVSMETEKITHGSSRWHEKYQHVADKAGGTRPNWPKFKQMVKDLITTDRSTFWRNYIKPLAQQGNLLKLIEAENVNSLGNPIIYDLPRGVLSIAVRASIDFLPTFSNLKTWRKDHQPNANFGGNQETLVRILNSCSVFFNQGRFTWRHDSILVHIPKALKNAIGTNSNIQIFVRYAWLYHHGGTLPLS